MTNKLSDEMAKQIDTALSELNRCWLPNGWEYHLNRDLAFNWVANHIDLVERIFEKAKAELEKETN